MIKTTEQIKQEARESARKAVIEKNNTNFDAYFCASYDWLDTIITNTIKATEERKDREFLDIVESVNFCKGEKDCTCANDFQASREYGKEMAVLYILSALNNKKV